MELKDYQARVLVDLANYLEVLDRTPNLAQAFAEHWASKGVRVGSTGGQAGWSPTKTRCRAFRTFAPRCLQRAARPLLQ